MSETTEWVAAKKAELLARIAELEAEVAELKAFQAEAVEVVFGGRGNPARPLSFSKGSKNE